MPISEFDRTCMERAVELAMEAEGMGNLPIGAVISLGEKIIAQGKSSIWQPELDLTRHAEMEALRSLSDAFVRQAREMTLYTTLEPCLMCMGAILLHQVGRVVFGAADTYGGGMIVVKKLPKFFEEQLERAEWIGPAFPEMCDPLFGRIAALEEDWLKY